jgi:hypothetical protein
MTADVLGSAADKAALMLADRRHRETFVGAVGGTVCSHCRDSWPCDARRALDACNALIGEADRWREHARIDCAALGRVWRLAALWGKQVEGDGTARARRLAQNVTRIRQAIRGTS